MTFRILGTGDGARRGKRPLDRADGS